MKKIHTQCIYGLTESNLAYSILAWTIFSILFFISFIFADQAISDAAIKADSSDMYFAKHDISIKPIVIEIKLARSPWLWLIKRTRYWEC